MVIEAPPLEAPALHAAAVRQTGGLTDFGDPCYRAALEVMLKSLREEANLSSTGATLFARRVVESLTNRLILESYCQRHSEILEEKVERPVVIIGLPRTGTTLLHRVLARDPRFYTAAWWETRFPSPLSEDDLVRPVRRIEMAKAEIEAIVNALPELLAIHPFDAELPDEEVILMEHSFLSAIDSYGNVPSYMAWLWQQDQTPAYTYLKRQLQFLQWQKRQRGVVAERWLLKAPHHTHLMPTLFKVFPDVQVIQTHRDPLQTIPSMGSFAFTLWRIYSDQADPVQAGRQWSSKFARGMRNAMIFRDGQPPGCFLDVWYLDAVTKPLEVAKAVYPFIGMPWSREAEQEMRSWIGRSGREKRPPHEYSYEKLGLSQQQLERDFALYRERHILPRLAERSESKQ